LLHGSIAFIISFHNHTNLKMRNTEHFYASNSVHALLMAA
jgi:hypothetical protein